MPGKGKPFNNGKDSRRCMNGPGRPKLDITSLADSAAQAVLEGDIALIEKAQKSPRSVSKLEVHRARERISRMCRGRIPTRIAIAGDTDDPSPVPFSYISIPTQPSPAPDAGGDGEGQEAAQ